MFSKINGNNEGNKEIYDNCKFGNNEIININESFYNKENCSNSITPNYFFKKNYSAKNVDSHYIKQLNKSKKKKKYKPINNKDRRYIIRRSNSCKYEIKSKKDKNNLLSNNNEKNISYNNKNFGLLPLKNIYNKLKQKEKNSSSLINRNIKSSVQRKKICNEKDNQRMLKMFMEKYEKEKENFNDILFDEFIELRKKKFKLESFIKRFTNKQFIEKLYKAKEYSIKKNMIV
jgi:hypothetical protein